MNQHDFQVALDAANHSIVEVSSLDGKPLLPCQDPYAAAALLRSLLSEAGRDLGTLSVIVRAGSALACLEHLLAE